MAEGTACELRQDHTEAASVLTLGSHTVGEVTCHVMRRLKQTHGEVHMVRNWDLLPTTTKELEAPAIG